jgi:hypothetical protein
VFFLNSHRWWSLTVCLLLSSVTGSYAAPRITEFMAANVTRLADEEGDFPDWIEVHNPDNVAVSLAGYHLTDDAANLDKWTFPAVMLAPDELLVVFASGKNRDDPAARLHTNFRLSADGDYLALVAPDGTTAVSDFAPSYPEQSRNGSFGLASQADDPVWSFFSTPTPGKPNKGGTRAGPTISVMDKNPTQPEAGPLTIEAVVRPTNGPVATVKLYYRKMFGNEAMLPMNDNGTGGDAVKGDRVWTAVIPGTALAAAEMTRWRFVATDLDGTKTKEPAYRVRRDSHQYFGTVAKDSGIRTSLSVLHWFTKNVSAAGSSGGSRGAVYYNGEFYDNVLFTRHGQSSAGFPKKSYNIDFNRTQRFRWNANEPRVADIDLITNWADKSKVRHVLAYEVMRESGVAAHFAFTVRVQHNGKFYSTADLIEDADEIYLRRAGLNREGALYKVYSNSLNKDSGDRATSGVEKKTRKFEKNTDLQALINGLDLRGKSLVNYLYDNIDIPRCVNLLAANSVIRNIDMHRKNWYIYRDSGQSDEWAILPWDLDLSHGRTWNSQNTYFDNRLYSKGFVVSGTRIRLVSHMFANPDMRAMIMRRIRTLTDRFLQPPPAPGTPESELYYERRLNEQSQLIDPPAITPSDAWLDFKKWGSWLQRGAKVRYTNTNKDVETMAEAIERWKTEYLPARRRYIYNTQIVGKGGEIPLPQTGGDPITNYSPLVAYKSAAKVLVPTNGNLGKTWTGNPTFEPLDTTGWLSGPTGVGYDRGTAYDSLIGVDVGRQMRNNTSVYIRIDFDVKDPALVDLLELRVKYDDGFVAYLNGEHLVSANSPDSPKWNSFTRVAHGANPRAYVKFDVSDKRNNLRIGRNILAIQGFNTANSSDLLIVPELYAGIVNASTTLEPKINFGKVEANPASGNQDEEFIQLHNPNSIAVDISDWRLTGGVEHTFAAGTVLAPNGTLYVSPSVADFRARSSSPKSGEGLFVQGGYRGHLSNFGESLVILDAAGATNNTTTFTGQASDTQRFLVLSELMYHPPGDNLAEYIELLNISRLDTLNLEGVRFTRGVEFDFTGSAVGTLAPGERVLVVRDLTAFESAYGVNHPVAGVFANGTALSNGGERLKLEDAKNGTILEFSYDDQAPWPTEADESGRSLVLIAPHTRPDPALFKNWRVSLQPGGSPGGADGAMYPSDPLADANGNGEPDLIDYALGNDLGLSPVFPEFSRGADVPGGEDTLILTVPISLAADGVEIELHFSTDLVEWQDGAAHLELVSTKPLGVHRALRAWHVKPPLSHQPQLYMRLHVVGR